MFVKQDPDRKPSFFAKREQRGNSIVLSAEREGKLKAESGGREKRQARESKKRRYGVSLVVLWGLRVSLF
jgi:hypothetical protein